jgi:hypothetical protein
MSEESLFHEALAKPASERAAFLEQACADQPGLRAAVEALLAAHEAPASLLDQPPDVLLSTTTDYHPAIAPGVVIAGRYTLVEKLGEGGMGDVWVAKQTEPVKRKVALKLIKTGMDSRAVLQRFEQERQALALMDHPHIARVLDGGLTPQGRPFFVMELVNGLMLTKFCDEARLTPRQRLELFVSICQAVQHAHQKGIIHRDLKPANILVTLIDGQPVPKVIDFGVAKATAGKLTEESLSTQFGAVIGTFEYMAPEQAGYAGVDSDTRADIYSLGVILYELLTGLKPFDGRRLRQAALTELLRMLKEEEPSKPSTRLSTEGALPSLAALRQTEPKKLMALLRGELDWVVMKCLEKQRDRRYETANGLARDLQRYLADEPVEARPPSTAYRLGKFLKRNKGPVAAVSLVLLALVVGIIGTTWGWLEAQRQEKLARDEATAKEEARQAEVRARLAAQSEKLLAEAARDNEAKERGYAEAVTQFVTDDFLALTSVEGQGRFGGEELTRYATLHDLLDRAAGKLQQRKDLAPRTEAELCWIIGVSYRGMGEAVRALSFLERSVALRRQAFGLDAEETLNAQNSLAVAYRAAGQVDLAVPLHELTLRIYEAKLGPDDPRTLTMMNNLATAYQEAGKRDLALPLLKQTLQLRKAKLGPDDPDTLSSMNSLAHAYWEVGKLDLALPLFEQTLQLRKAKLGPDDLDTLISMNNLAKAYEDASKRDLALPLFEQTLQLRKAKLGSDHPLTLLSMHNLASAYEAAGKLELALPLFEQTLQLRKAKLGPDDPDTLSSMSSLASAYLEAGKLELALPLYEQTLPLRKAKLGPDHRDTLTSMNNLARAYQAAGKLDLALPLFEQTFPLMKAKLGPDDPHTLTSMNNLARAYWQQQQPDKAIPLFEGIVKLQEAKLGRDHERTLGQVAALGANYRDAGRLQEALPLLEEAYRAAKKYPKLRWVGTPLLDAYAKAGEKVKLGNLLREQLSEVRTTRPRDSPQFARRLAQISLILLEQKQWAEAEPLLRECLAIREKTQPDDWLIFNTKSMLGGALLGQKKYSAAEPLLRAGYEGLKKQQAKLPPPGQVRLPEAAERLVQLYEATGKKDEAARWRTEWERYTGKVVGQVHEIGTGLELKGQLDIQAPALVYQVKFVTSKTYIIDMVSLDPKTLDPFLFLMDATGKKLAEDDDSGGGFNARIVFHANEDGTYRIRATSFNVGHGTFTLTVREQPKPPRKEED